GKQHSGMIAHSPRRGNQFVIFSNKGTNSIFPTLSNECRGRGGTDVFGCLAKGKLQFASVYAANTTVCGKGATTTSSSVVQNPPSRPQPFHNPCVPPRSEGTHPRPMRWMGRPRQKLGRQHNSLACSASALTDSVRGPRRGWLRSDGGSGSMGGPARLSAQPLRGALSGPSAPVAASAAAGRRTARRGGPGSSP
ncbi:unnamed protein product, partial [Prorocentrum cordatum]